MTIVCVTLHPAVDRVLRVPTLQPNEAARCTVEMVYGGGKGNNVARALSGLNLPVIATGYQGGHTGTFITEEIQKEGIQTRYVTTAEPTRISTMIQVDDTGNTYPVYEPGQKVSEAEIQELMDTLDRLLDEASLVLLCGSGQTDRLSRVYADMIVMARERGVHTLLDSSGGALMRGIDARPFMVKVNRHELGGYLGRDLAKREDQIEAMREVQAMGIDIVALSRGEEGMIAYDGKEFWEGVLHMESIINVNGCGDSQLAGVAKMLTEGAPLSEIVRWGIACGTANTQVRGAGYIKLDKVEALLPRVDLTRLDE